MKPDCRQARKAFQEWMDGHGSDELLDVFRAHTRNCRNCREFGNSLLAFDRLNDIARPQHMKAELVGAIMDRVGSQPAADKKWYNSKGVALLAGAAAVLLAVGIGIGGMYKGEHRPGDTFRRQADHAFATRGGGEDVMGIRLFCVSGATNSPVIREVSPRPPFTSCRVGDVLQASATIPGDSKVTCVLIVGRDSKGTELFRIPSAKTGCIELERHAGSLINEPLAGGVRIGKEWEGKLVNITAYFGQDALKRAAPENAALGTDSRVFRVMGR